MLKNYSWSGNGDIAWLPSHVVNTAFRGIGVEAAEAGPVSRIIRGQERFLLVVGHCLFIGLHGLASFLAVFAISIECLGEGKGGVYHFGKSLMEDLVVH